MSRTTSWSWVGPLDSCSTENQTCFSRSWPRDHLGRRKAYYLVEVSRIFDPLPVPRSRLRKIGWTKLQLIGKHVNPENLDDLLTLAESTNSKELERQMRGEQPLGNAHCVVMYFSPKQYAEFEEALLKNGAKQSGRGMVDKEKALINALRKAIPGLEKVHPAKGEAGPRVAGGVRVGRKVRTEHRSTVQLTAFATKS